MLRMTISTRSLDAANSLKEDSGTLRHQQRRCTKDVDGGLRRLNLHQSLDETLHIRQLENGLERPWGT
jgi:hypothetical protein